MPTLLEVQCAMRCRLLGRGNGDAAEFIFADGLAPEARLDVYRNTAIEALTTALRLAYPAVHRLVGAEFFEGAARIFIDKEPPQSAYLDEYGAAFPDFLAGFHPAASLPYLAGAAHLEWAVNRAFHAPDSDSLDLLPLSAIDPADHGRVVFTPHPSMGLVHADCPVDAIWRAVLARDDAAMAAIDLGFGPVWLLVQRRHETGVDVRRISETEWRFAAQLCAGRPLQAALDATSRLDAAAALAEHLAASRFTGFRLEPAQ